MYLFKVKNGNTRTVREICWKIKVPERCHWHLAVVFPLKQPSHIILVFPLLTLNKPDGMVSVYFSHALKNWANWWSSIFPKIIRKLWVFLKPFSLLINFRVSFLFWRLLRRLLIAIYNHLRDFVIIPNCFYTPIQIVFWNF